MPSADNFDAGEQSKRFLYLYALAVAGGSVAYVPFLTILLPNQVAALWENDALAILAQMTFAGAIAASVANVLFGWASDRMQNRRLWVAAGMLTSSVLLPTMQYATSSTLFIATVMCWQFGLNMMLAPLFAWGGDSVPDSQKGLLGGLMAFAPAIGALSGALVTLPGMFAQNDRLTVVSALVIIMVCPVILMGRPRPMPQLVTPAKLNDHAPQQTQSNHGSVIRMWTARLLVQIAEASLFAFLLLWFRSVSPAFKDNDTAIIFAVVLGLAVFASLIVGRWSDRYESPIRPLAISAGIAAIGLLIMAFAESLSIAIVGYVVFGLSSSVFLALHSTQTLRVLPAPETRGRDLGIFNLTNTLPSVVMPGLTLTLVPNYGFDTLFILLAGLSGLACILLFNLPTALQPTDQSLR